MPRCCCRRNLAALSVALSLNLLPTFAQTPDSPLSTGDQPAKPYTLHVYANLVQVPTLVVTGNNKPIPSLTRDRFDITIDGGAPFHPSLLRLQGDDPIDFAILLDEAGDQTSFTQAFIDAFPHLAPDFLHPHDHISIYAVDCSLVRSSNDMPADPTSLVTGFTNALQTPTLHGKKSKAACFNSLRLWDSISLIANNLYQLPGRRVLLVVSTGQDSASTSTAVAASNNLSMGGITFFSLREDYLHDLHGDPFHALARQNGGLNLQTTRDRIARQLQDLFTMLRGRYLLEFARPDDGEPGLHIIDVKIPNLSAIIRSTGVTIPVADPAIFADPTTIPSAPSPATMGKHPSH